MRNSKSFIATLMIAILTIAMTACGKQPAPVETATTVSSIETPASVSVSVEEPEPEPVYTLKDCFKEGTTVIDSESSFADYINSHKGMIVRAVVAKRTYEGIETVDTDKSETETFVNQEVYAGVVYDEKLESDKLKARIFSDGDAQNFTDIELEENATLFDVYKGVLKSVKLDNYFESMWMTADTEVDEDVMNKALEDKEYRVISEIPADAVFATMLPEEEYKEIVVGQFDYDLITTDAVDVSANDVSAADVSKNEETNTSKFAFPSYVDAFLQYVNTEDRTVTYSVNVVYIPVNDLTEIESRLALVKEVPVHKPEQKVESQPAADPHNPIYEGGIYGYPASVDGYNMTTMYDDGNTFYIYKCASRKYCSNATPEYSTWFGDLQHQAEAAFIERGHAKASWHIEHVTSEVNKWYLADY